MKKVGEYYLGLDIGTDSVGYATTDQRYNLLKYKGKPMWGSHLFDAANQCADRRGFRTARRRLDRRQQRVQLVDEIFAPEVSKVDPKFYTRRKASALYGKDRPDLTDANSCFNDKGYTDKEYHEEYPTIHHLIVDLMKNTEKKFDIRLINIAVDWLVAHRGHFLSDVGTNNIDRVLEFDSIYEEFISYFDGEGFERPWDSVDAGKFGEVLKEKGVNRKKLALKDLLYGGTIPSDEDYFIDRKELVNFLAGGKVHCNKLFRGYESEDDITMTISDDMEILLPQLGDYATIVGKMAAMYDWSVLSDILSSHAFISEAKVKVYEQHGEDLRRLKAFVKEYYPRKKYNEIFRESGKDCTNYTAYSYNLKSVGNGAELPKGKATREDFLKYLKQALDLDKITCRTEEDQQFVDELKERIAEGSFLPKQVNSDNRVIPYQLYYAELQKILDNASRHYDFLNAKDGDGYVAKEKLLSVFKFKIPYYVGPLKKEDDSPYAWIVKKADGPVRPWNFEEKVDLDKSESAFIDRMTNSCSYIPGENVLPKNSLLYTKYMVLNEINNIKVNGVAITVEAKQEIYEEVFCKNRKVTPKMIKGRLVTSGCIQKEDEISGIDVQVNASMKSRYDFRKLLSEKKLTEDDVEGIIARSTYTEDRYRYKKWLKENYPQFDEKELRDVAKLRYTDFGRLSRYFLSGLQGASKETGEVGTIMHFLWNTNENLMQLLSDRYTFVDEIEKLRNAYYAEHKMGINEQMENLGISNAVKRPVTRTLAVVDDVVSTIGHAPAKIFVEMARGEDEKKQRSVTRKDQILNYYRDVEEDTRLLEKQLEDMGDTANNRLQSDALFLYYMQLGKCMYSGEPIDLALIKTDKYNIDHIYPQSLVKDDSILNNRVLVLSKINGDKKDVYPIDKDIRVKMQPFWKHLCDAKLITKEKYDRLTRGSNFTDEEKMGFINRQLVETRQSMKAVTQILHNLYPESEIIYVKARLASDFKKVFDLAPKSRIINDLHHAKDAYLNVVAGNVYHEKFTKRWFKITDEYSMKTKVIFSKDLVRNGKTIWDHEHDLQTVRKSYAWNDIHLTRYAYCQKGGLFDQMPVKKGKGQVSLKDGMNIDMYGGYNKPTASFFTIAKYLKGGKKEVSFVPVDLMAGERFLKDEEFAREYVKKTLQEINTKKIDNVEFPCKNRVVRIKSTLLIDNVRVWVNGKSNGGKIILLTSAESAYFDRETTIYIGKIEKYAEKKKLNRNLRHDEQYDGLSCKNNIRLYNMIVDKLRKPPFSDMPGNQAQTLEDGKFLFEKCEFDIQIQTLLNCLNLLKSGRAGGCDLKAVGGKNSSGAMTLGANVSSGKYKRISIVNYSPAGLHVSTSDNILEM